MQPNSTAPDPSAQATLARAQQPPNIQTESASGPAPQIPAQPTNAQGPTVLRPVRRTGLAGIVDEFADAVAGKQTSQVYQDDQGNKYIQHPYMTRGQQWQRIASEAIHGAGAGLAVGQGPGGGARAFEAGIQSSDQQRAQIKQEQRQQEQDVKQAQLDKFNLIKLQHDTAAADFALTRMKVQADEQDVTFAQSQEDRERNLQSIDLGTFKDAGELASIKDQHPDFWKDVYAGNIRKIPEFDENGNRTGIHVWLRTPDIGNAPVPEGTKVAFAQPGENPNDPPKLVWREISGLHTQNQVDAYNDAAWKVVTDWQQKHAEQNLKTSETELNEIKKTTQKTEQVKNLAEAGKARMETVNPAGNQAMVADNAEGLATGRLLMGKDIPVRTSKDQLAAAEYNKAANDYSMAHFGLPYGPEIIRQEAHLAEQKQTQATLDAIDRMIGQPGLSGQLDQVLAYARAAGITNKGGTVATPWSELRQWVKERVGNTAAKQFEQILSDTQSALGTLIGNPLIGGGESDLKLRTAQKQFGQDATIENLEGQVAVAKQVLERARDGMAKKNRYIQQRYGEAYSPASAAAPAGGPQPAPAPGAMVKVQIPGQPPGQIPAAALEKFQHDNPTATVIR